MGWCEMASKKTIVSATRDMARAVNAPEWTDTWHPIDHATVIDSLFAAVRNVNLNVVGEQYTLVNDGARMFGRWTLDQRVNGIHFAVGFRNSIDKSMAIGVCAGTFVLVCSNMCFNGDWVEFRMHTGKLDIDELNAISANAVGSVIEKTTEFAEWHRSLKSFPMPTDSPNWKSFMFDVFDRNIVPPARFNRVMELHDIENGRDVGSRETFYSAHAAITNVLKADNMFTVSRRTAALNELTNEYIGKFRDGA